MSTRLVRWERWRQLPPRTRNGVLTASQTGMAVAYGLQGVQERGQPFIGPGTQVYEGMIIGLNRRGGDIDVNATKQKQKTNMRASTEDATVKLVPPRQMSLEECLDFIEDDELVARAQRRRPDQAAQARPGQLVFIGPGSRLGRRDGRNVDDGSGVTGSAVVHRDIVHERNAER